MIVVNKRYKACPRCRLFKIRNTVHFYARKQRGRRQLDSWCKRCRLDEANARTHAMLVANGEAANRHRARQRAYRADKRESDPAFAVAEAERSRNYRNGLSKEQRERYLFDARIRAKIVRERAGMGTRPATSQEWVGIGSYLPLDPAPVLAFVERHGGPAGAAKGNEHLARALHRIVSGESKHVDIGVVDQLVMANDLLLHDIYDPSKYPEAFA